MKIVIKFNKKCKDTDSAKRIIERANIKENIKTSLDNGMGLNIINVFGDWVYKIRIKK